MTRKGANMVDPLGVKPVQTAVLTQVPTGERGAPVARLASATAGNDAEQPANAGQSAIASTAKEFAASPPVDVDRIAKIRKAIADGNFPIYPSTIADRLIASKYDWLRNDAQQ